MTVIYKKREGDKVIDVVIRNVIKIDNIGGQFRVREYNKDSCTLIGIDQVSDIID